MKIVNRANTCSFVLLFLLLDSGAAGSRKGERSAPDFTPARMAMHTITAAESQNHVNILASDELQGREAGTPGQWLAAKYIASQFADLGLRPGGEAQKYYQQFKLMRRELRYATLRVKRLTADSEPDDYLTKNDIIPFSFTEAAQLDVLPVVFAGYGITAPEFDYDDYRNLDVKGKIVLVLRHEPQENDPESRFQGRAMTRHAHFLQKAKNAHAHGAAAMLLVTDIGKTHDADRHSKWPPYSVRFTSLRRWTLPHPEDFAVLPAAWISTEVAQNILQQGRVTLPALQRLIDVKLEPVSFEIPATAVELDINTRVEMRSTENVVGYIAGWDPELNHEAIVVGAHYDHIGVQGGKVFNGADDNASGTAALLEIAEAFVVSERNPRRSIVFIAFSAEELGLLGSKYYVEEPLFAMQHTVSMINMDMISRNDENQISVIGSNRSHELHEMNLAANEEVGLQLSFDGEKYFNRSDQANFARHHVPVIFYNSGDHSDYHRPTDTWEKVNSQKIAKVSRLAFLVTWHLANSDIRPSYGKFEMTNKY